MDLFFRLQENYQTMMQASRRFESNVLEYCEGLLARNGNQPIGFGGVKGVTAHDRSGARIGEISCLRPSKPFGIEFSREDSDHCGWGLTNLHPSTVMDAVRSLRVMEDWIGVGNEE